MPALPPIEPFARKLGELELRSQQPDFYADPRQAGVILRELQRLKGVVDLEAERQALLRRTEESRALAADPAQEAELRELARADAEEAAARLPDLERRLLAAMIPAEPNDRRNTILEIRAGTGGDEATLFAAELLRLYQRYIEQRGWRCESLGASPSEAGGVREAALLVTGENAYKTLKHESGVHRVQRVPVTEANGRIHTSTVTVAVLPEAEEVDVQINPADLEITVSRASGPGGQGVNTTDSAVQIVHRPTGLIVTCADERSQIKNKAKALTVLRSRLLRAKEEAERARYAESRREQIGMAERSDKIRTYNFPQNRMTDHRIGLTLHNLPQVMEGGIEEVVSALLQSELEEKIAALLRDGA